MLDYIKIKEKRSFLAILFLLVTLVIVGTYIEFHVLVEIAKVLILLAFIMAFKKTGLHFSSLFKVILGFIFLNIIIRLLPQVENALALIFNVSAYILLCYYALKSLKMLKIKDVTDIYFIIMVLINCVVAFLFYKTVAVKIESFLYFILVAIHIVVVLFLSFSAFAVFIQNGKKKSLLFVFMVLAFLFSDIMFALNAFYKENIVMVIGDELLNITAWYFMFSFFYEKQFGIINEVHH